MFALIKCFYPEGYSAADHAVITVTENLILMLDKRLAQAKAVHEEGFFGTKWWDYTPYFIPCGGPESVDLDMSEEDFENTLESNSYIHLSDTFKRPDDYIRMSPVVLTMCLSRGEDTAIGYFYWTGTHEHIGSSCRVETYQMHEDIVDEWAKIIGCTEILTKVRKCRGIEPKPLIKGER